MKHFYWIFIFVIGIALLTGCEEIAKSQNPLVVNWMAQEQLSGYQEILTFQPDNTVYFSSSFGRSVFSYEIRDGKIYLTELGTGKKATYDFEILGDYKAIKFRGVTYYPYDQ